VIILRSDIAVNLETVRKKIVQAAGSAGRDPREITLIGVSKTVPAERVREAVELGVLDLGENRVQGATEKMDLLPGLGIRWHFIGSLQTNKVKYILPRVKLIHSLDRFSLAKELHARAEKLNLQANCLVEVNVAGEASKSGLSPDEVPDFVRSVVSEYPRVKIAGLMTVAPYAEDPEQVRCYFRQLKLLFDRLAQAADGYSMTHLSMGMSNDYPVAIAEGATMVRIGTAIFGRR
jgi:hypothetical protein